MYPIISCTPGKHWWCLSYETWWAIVLIAIVVVAVVVGILGTIGMIALPAIPLVGVAASPLILVALLALGAFAVYKSVKCKKGMLSHVLAFLFAPFWLFYHYKIDKDKDKCGVNQISAGQLDAYSKMISQNY